MSPIQLELSWCCPSCLRSRGSGRTTQRPRRSEARSGSQRRPGSLGPRVSGVFLILFDASEVQRSVQGCTRPRSVDLLDRRLGWRAEGRVVGDAVTIAVGGDHARGLAPGRSPSRFGGPRAECLRPRHALGQRAVEYGVGACRDELLSLVESRSHLNIDDAVRLWDEAGDKSRWLASPARACGAAGGPLDPVEIQSFLQEESRVLLTR